MGVCEPNVDGTYHLLRKAALKCTKYSVQNTVYKIQCTIYSVKNTVYSLKRYIMLPIQLLRGVKKKKKWQKISA